MVAIHVSRFTWPETTNIGMESVHAPNTPLSALMLPGPVVTFTTPGTYQYFCYLHPFMTGTIVVEAATGGNTK